jgi:hypothetical protein
MAIGPHDDLLLTEPKQNRPGCWNLSAVLDTRKLRRLLARLFIFSWRDCFFAASLFLRSFAISWQLRCEAA